MTEKIDITDIERRINETISYPGERLLEYWLPGLDTWIDKILYMVLSVEEIAVDKKLRAEREQIVIDLVWETWGMLPIPSFIRKWIDPILDGIMRRLIRQVVEWLNDALGHSWPKASEL